MRSMTGHKPWLESYPKDVPMSLAPYPEISAWAMLEDAAERHADKPSLAWFGRHMSYGWLKGETERFSAVLAGLGVGKGDRVGVILPNSPQYVIAYYATVRLGAVIVGNNPLYSQRELSHQLSYAGCEVVVVLDQLWDGLAAVLGEVKLREIVVTGLEDYMSFPKNVLAPRLVFKKHAKAEGKPWPPVPRGSPVKRWKVLMKSAGAPPAAAEVDAKRDPAGFIYTGGTTGLSKGAMLSHFNIVANAMQSAAWFIDIEDGAESMMCVLPFFHSYWMTVGMNLGILKAAKLVLLPRFELARALEAIEKEKVTLFPGVPRIYIALNESPKTKEHDLSSIKFCLSGAAPLPLAVAQKFHEISGRANLVEGYGLTETSPVAVANPLDGRAREGSIGMPLPDTDCRIVDLEDTDREVPQGERGELCIMGPQVMMGYWNKPEETAASIRDGWFLTGDIAIMDPDGFFRIVDRKKEMVIVSGFKVFPTDVEQVLYHHPKVVKACVIGVPDETTGEAVKAFVVLREGETATPGEIIAWCKDPQSGLTGYRVPKYIEFRDALPETLVGKVLRRVLVEEEFQKQHAPKG